MALHVCDTHRRNRLLRMLEWDARATGGLKHDVWYGAGASLAGKA